MASRSCCAFPNIGRTERSPPNHDVMMMRRMRRIMMIMMVITIVYDDASKHLVKWPLGRWRPDASRLRQTTANPAPMIRNFFNAIKIFRLHFLSVSCQTLHCFLSQYLLSFSQGCCRCLVALYIFWHCDLWGARGEDKRLVRCFESQGGAVSGTRQDLCTYSASRLL